MNEITSSSEPDFTAPDAAEMSPTSSISQKDISSSTIAGLDSKDEIVNTSSKAGNTSPSPSEAEDAEEPVANSMQPQMQQVLHDTILQHDDILSDNLGKDQRNIKASNKDPLEFPETTERASDDHVSATSVKVYLDEDVNIEIIPSDEPVRDSLVEIPCEAGNDMSAHSIRTASSTNIAPRDADLSISISEDSVKIDMTQENDGSNDKKDILTNTASTVNIGSAIILDDQTPVQVSMQQKYITSSSRASTSSNSSKLNLVQSSNGIFTKHSSALVLDSVAIQRSIKLPKSESIKILGPTILVDENSANSSADIATQISPSSATNDPVFTAENVVATESSKVAAANENILESSSNEESLEIEETVEANPSLPITTSCEFIVNHISTSCEIADAVDISSLSDIQQIAAEGNNIDDYGREIAPDQQSINEIDQSGMELPSQEAVDFVIFKQPAPKRLVKKSKESSSQEISKSKEIPIATRDSSEEFHVNKSQVLMDQHEPETFISDEIINKCSDILIVAQSTDQTSRFLEADHQDFNEDLIENTVISNLQKQNHSYDSIISLNSQDNIVEVLSLKLEDNSVVNLNDGAGFNDATAPPIRNEQSSSLSMDDNLVVRQFSNSSIAYNHAALKTDTVTGLLAMENTIEVLAEQLQRAACITENILQYESKADTVFIKQSAAMRKKLDQPGEITLLSDYKVHVRKPTVRKILPMEEMKSVSKANMSPLNQARMNINSRRKVSRTPNGVQKSDSRDIGHGWNKSIAFDCPKVELQSIFSFAKEREALKVHERKISNALSTQASLVTPWIDRIMKPAELQMITEFGKRGDRRNVKKFLYTTQDSRASPIPGHRTVIKKKEKSYLRNEQQKTRLDEQTQTSLDEITSKTAQATTSDNSLRPTASDLFLTKSKIDNVYNDSNYNSDIEEETEEKTTQSKSRSGVMPTKTRAAKDVADKTVAHTRLQAAKILMNTAARALQAEKSERAKTNQTQKMHLKRPVYPSQIHRVKPKAAKREAYKESSITLDELNPIIEKLAIMKLKSMYNEALEKASKELEATGVNESNSNLKSSIHKMQRLPSEQDVPNLRNIYYQQPQRANIMEQARMYRLPNSKSSMNRSSAAYQMVSMHPSWNSGIYPPPMYRLRQESQGLSRRGIQRDGLSGYFAEDPYMR